MAAVYLERVFGEIERLQLPFTRGINLEQWFQLRRAIGAGLNSPPCSSMGRLFDAVCALLGVRESANYEGQAAIELEQMAEQGEKGVYPFEIIEYGDTLIVNPDPMIEAIVQDIRGGEASTIISARFHNSVAKVVCEMAQKLREWKGLSDIFLSGGVFQNTFLLGRLWDMLREKGFAVYTHQRVPSNDGCISLGQAYYALHLQGAESIQ
jgi:hydrogenase maturation protein HypF